MVMIDLRGEPFESRILGAAQVPVEIAVRLYCDGAKGRVTGDSGKVTERGEGTSCPNRPRENT